MTTARLGSAPPDACVWCGAPLGPAGLRLPGRIRCAACGAATTDPWPGADVLAEAYARYRPESGRFSGFGDALLRRTRAKLAVRIDRLAPPGPVLDVGAGDGTLVDALRGLGREALGLERESKHEAVSERRIEELDGGWSAVVFWHSLEHLPAPGHDLDRAVERLTAGGMVLVAIPNVESLQALAFGENWLHLDRPRHLVHLTAGILRERLERRGLEVTRVSHWRGGQIVFGWLHGLVGRLPGRPDLYDAIRRPEARSRPMAPTQRALTLLAGTLLLVPAVLASALEIAIGRGGTVLVEARRA